MPNNQKEQTATTNVGKATTNTVQVNKTTLLSLPDDVLDIIFSHLDAFDTSLACQKRDSFSLALANKRLFGLFPYHLSSITPRISNESLPAVALPHMLSVVRLAGNWLRELHVSKPSYDILPLLPDLCPNLRKLVLNMGFCSEHVRAIKPIVSNLRSLSIIRPVSETLKYLAPPPEELHLTELREEATNELVEILRHPLRKFHLHIGEYSKPPRLSVRLLSVLHQVCPKMEELCVKLVPKYLSTDFCMNQLLRDVKSINRNAVSKCQKMVLHGEGLGALMKHAHPRAFVEISVREQTVVDDAGNCYVKGIPSTVDYLREPFLSMINQITEIVITEDVDPRWKELLNVKRFKRVLVQFPANCEGFEVSADVVDVHVLMLWVAGTEWSWLRDVDEVKLVGSSFRVCCPDDAVHVLRSLAKFLKTFRGTRVWLPTPIRFSVWTFSPQLLYEAVKTLEALNEFERRGGDATTLRNMLDFILE